MWNSTKQQSLLLAIPHNSLQIYCNYIETTNDTIIKKLKSEPYSSVQVQLASAKLAIFLKNSRFGVENPSFFLGLLLSFLAMLLILS